MEDELQLAINDYCVGMTCGRCRMKVSAGVYICHKSVRDKKQEYVDTAIEALVDAGYDLSFISMLKVTEEDVLAIFSE